MTSISANLVSTIKPLRFDIQKLLDRVPNDLSARLTAQMKIELHRQRLQPEGLPLPAQHSSHTLPAGIVGFCGSFIAASFVNHGYFGEWFSLTPRSLLMVLVPSVLCSAAAAFYWRSTGRGTTHLPSTFGALLDNLDPDSEYEPCVSFVVNFYQTTGLKEIDAYILELRDEIWGLEVQRCQQLSFFSESEKLYREDPTNYLSRKMVATIASRFAAIDHQKDDLRQKIIRLHEVKSKISERIRCYSRKNIFTGLVGMFRIGK